ncbi:MAG: DUF2267 domain-containing protein [Candidatus Binatia bacterium]
MAGHWRCDEQRAESITFVVFQELRVRITPTEAANVAAQLPTGLKRLWLEGERSDRPVDRMHMAEFIGRVRQHAALPDDAEAERGTRAVFAVLQHLLGSPTGTEGEAWTSTVSCRRTSNASGWTRAATTRGCEATSGRRASDRRRGGHHPEYLGWYLVRCSWRCSALFAQLHPGISSRS